MAADDRMDASSATSHLRHRSSLEGVIDFSPGPPPLDAAKRAQAKGKFYRIVNHFEAADTNRSNAYNRLKLIRLTYEYSRSEESYDIFLRAFFQAMALSMDGEDDVGFDNKEREEELGSGLVRFAEYLFDNFFLPLRASSQRTPQPSPAYHSIIQRVQGGGVQDFVGTQGRVSQLRGDCLIRDRHRCIISGRFDQKEAMKRIRRSGNEAEDDDGNLLLGTRFGALEVAHILPHALTKVETNHELHPSKKVALDILNMFDNGVIHLIGGDNIDRSRNAITLTSNLHEAFGAFEVFFQLVSDAEPHTYRIDTFLPSFIFENEVPVTRTLRLTESRTIDPPSPRLLAIHYAIAHILHLSGAGGYIDDVLRDMESKAVQADGSSELGRFVDLRLGGWLDGSICA